MLVGDNLEEMFAGLNYSLSERRRVVLNGVEDGMSFSEEYTDEELPAQVRGRVLGILKSQGWVMYERK
jgi:hypothetical protein